MKPFFVLLAAAAVFPAGRALTQDSLKPDSGGMPDLPAPPVVAAAPAEPEKSAPAPADFAERIKSAIADREKRLLALNEAMLRLREAGETEEASRIQERLLAMIDSLSGPVMTDVLSGQSPVVNELNALKMRHDELTLQVRGLQEQMKRIGAEETVQAAEPVLPRSGRSR